MNLKNSINQFYFDMTISELRLMNNNQCYPNVTYNSLLYLNIIDYKKDCTVSFIAEAMNVAKSAVTVKVNEMLKQGLVVKTQSTKDKRINYLSINEELVSEYAVYDNAMYRAIEIIEERYPKEKIDTFCEILNQLSSIFGGNENEKQRTI